MKCDNGGDHRILWRIVIDESGARALCRPRTYRPFGFDCLPQSLFTHISHIVPTYFLCVPHTKPLLLLLFMPVGDRTQAVSNTTHRANGQRAISQCEFKCRTVGRLNGHGIIPGGQKRAELPDLCKRIMVMHVGCPSHTHTHTALHWESARWWKCIINEYAFGLLAWPFAHTDIGPFRNCAHASVEQLMRGGRVRLPMMNTDRQRSFPTNEIW